MSIYMKVPGVDGSVTTKGYEKWIELTSLGFGVSRQVAMDVGNVSNRAAGLPQFSEVSVSKEMDESSYGLMNDAVLGKEGKLFEIACVEVGDTAVETVKYDLDNSIISSYSPSGSGGQGGGRPYESMSISFSKITASFSSKDKAGASGAKPRVIYDLATASK
jgi:type VI secretion system secreted protein Hcp